CGNLFGRPCHRVCHRAHSYMEVEDMNEFLRFSREELVEKLWPRLRGCVESLTEEQTWWRPNEASNSIGNLILHLNGNVRQWLVASFGHLEDTRERPAEFAERQVIPPAALLERLSGTLQEASAV